MLLRRELMHTSACSYSVFIIGTLEHQAPDLVRWLVRYSKLLLKE